MGVRTWFVSAEEAEAHQRQAADALAHRGLGPGDRVALALGNSPAVLHLTLGALRVGIVPVLCNAGLLPHEVDALVEDARPALTIRDEGELEALVASGHSTELAPVPLARPMHYTSGTSGRPKGVWSGILAEDDARALHETEADLWEFGDGDTHLVCSPLYHSVAVRLASACLLRGGNVLLLERFDAGTVADALATGVVTTTFVVPTHFQRLFALPAPPRPRPLRRLVHAGAPCPEPLKREAMERFPGVVWEFYGSTEGQFTVCSPDEWLAWPGTVGRARPDRSLDVDADGQIWCRVPPYAHFEYWGLPDATAGAWRDGAFTVGDLGRLDTDGYLFLDGRRDDLVVTGGVNVYPAEVEQVLATMPGVHEVAVFGAPDEHWGQRVCAAVVGDVSEAAVSAFAREHLAAYKCPKDVYLVTDLPRTGTGKLRRGVLAGALGLAVSPPGKEGNAGGHDVPSDT